MYVFSILTSHGTAISIIFTLLSTLLISTMSRQGMVNGLVSGHVYLTIIPRERVGYEMIDSQLGATCLVGYNHLISNKREWNNCFITKNPQKTRWISPTRTNRKRQGTSSIHMSHVYQNCQRADRLAWTAWMKNQNIAAMNIIFLKSHRDSRILHSRTAKETWQIMWRERIFRWHLLKLPWIWIFGAVFGEVACYEVFWSHQLVLLNEKRSYTDVSIAVVNGCVACICGWLLVLYILDVE